MSTAGTASGQGIYSSVPTYDYSKLIKTPIEMGVNSDKSWDQFDWNLAKATNYEQFIMSDQNYVSKTDRALGMNYLLDTNTQCTATDLGGTSVERYTYIQTNIPTGMLFSSISDIENGFNPTNLELAFTTSIDCQGVTLSTIDVNNMYGEGTAWFAKSEI